MPRLPGRNWIGGHQYFGAAPEIVVPDNLKAGVQRAHRYEPQLNRSYRDWAEHYRVAILPARPRRPRDKPVEAGVLVAERWILARLRNRRLFSLGELNEAIAELLERLKSRSCPATGARCSSRWTARRCAVAGAAL